MDEVKASIEKRIAALREEHLKTVLQGHALLGGIHELEQLLSGFDQPADAPTELPVREVA